MRVLVASDELESALQEVLYESRRQYVGDSEVEIVALSSARLPAAIYDYDVVIVDHTVETALENDWPLGELLGNVVQLREEVGSALRQGRVMICVAGKEPGELIESLPRYEWVEEAGIELKASGGDRTAMTRRGAASGVKEYLTNLGRYFAECEAKSPTVPPPLARHLATTKALAVIRDTDFAVAMELSYPSGGFMIVVPPPKQYDIIALHKLVGLGSHYFERAARKVVIGEEPPWVEQYKTEGHKRVQAEIQELGVRRQELDTITYLLYGTGDDLVESVRRALADLGIQVKSTAAGENVDLELDEETGEVRLFFEVTGSKGPVKKTSSKVGQAWQFIRDREDPSQKLVIVANSYRHLPLEQRKGKPAFTEDAADLFQPHGILMMTTAQLYSLWTDVQEGRKKAEEVRELLTSETGVLDVAKV